MSDDLISRKAVIEAVDRHTNEDGTLDDDISVILEAELKSFWHSRLEAYTLAIEIVEKGGVE